MDPPPPTPLSELPSNIFHNPDGSPIGIFAEAGHIHNRPQLVRKLKRHGAIIRTDPKDAQIILVNPESAQGKIFARNWGSDANKVVLDSAWAGKCFAQEHALLEEDDYGGCVVVDDGLPIDNDEDQESSDEISKSPLPTPRDTPIEPVEPKHPVKPNPKGNKATKHVAQNSGDFTKAGPSRTADAPPQPQPPQAPQAPAINGFDVAAMAQMMQQYVAAAAMAPSQMPLMMNQQQPMMPMFPGFGNFAAPQANMQSDPFWMAMMDTMMNKGLFPTQQPSMQLPHTQFPRSVPTSPVQQQVLPFPPIPSPEGNTKTKGKQRVVSPSSKRRKISSSSFQEAVPKNGKPNGKPVSSSMGPPSDKQIFMTRTGPLAFFVQVGGHNRFGLVQSIKKNGGTIVTNVSDADYVILFPPAGSSKTDKTHESFLAMAKASDLPAVSARFVHDSLEEGVILDTEAYQFTPSLRGKRKRSDAAIRSRSPVDIESEDEDDEDDDESPAKYDEKTAQEMDLERRRLEKNKRERDRRQRMQEERREARESARSTQPETPAPEPGPSTQSAPQAPRPRGRPRKALTISTASSKHWRDEGLGSPTPPQQQILWGKGFKFSEEENAFAIEYAKILVQRDHEISLSSVTNHIHRKLPHHTLISWRTHLQTLQGFDFEVWKKRAGIVFRKAQLGKQPSLSSAAPSPSVAVKREPYFQDLHSDPLETTSPTAEVARKATSVSHGNTHANVHGNAVALEEDLNVIAKFFACGGDDQTETEEVIWAKLTAQASCQTEATWEEFYQGHSDEVQRRYQALVDAQATQ